MTGRNIVLALIAGLILSPPAAAQQYQVIVNAANATTALSADEVARLFQKKSTRWDDGQVVAPVDLPQASPLRAAFSERVHGRPVSAMRAYWQRQIFSGRGVPPVEKASEDEVVAFVAANPNAIGYVSASKTLGSGVKAVRVTGGGG